MANDPRHVITLVHGTFARKAKWTKEKSKLCQYISKSLDGNVRFETFSWSGRNRFLDRKIASRNLVEHITKVSQNFPNSHQHIIAHSHGGNIVINIDKLSILRVCSIICISTPFIHVKKRDSEFSIFFPILYAIFTMIMCYFSIYYLISSGLPFPLSIDVFNYANFQTATEQNISYIFDNELQYRCFLMMALVILCSAVLYFAIMRVSALNESLVQSATPTLTDMESKKFLLVRTQSDEASLLISVSNFLKRLNDFVFGCISALSIGIPYIALLIVQGTSAIVTALFPIFYILSFIYDVFWMNESIIIAFFSSFIQAGFLILLCTMYFVVYGSLLIFWLLFFSAVWLWPAWALNGLLSLSLGRELSLCLNTVSATAESAPVGSFLVFHSIDEEDSDDDSGSILNHSRGYNSTPVLKEIAKWMSTRSEIH